jgi:hypothetical protein
VPEFLASLKDFPVRILGGEASEGEACREGGSEGSSGDEAPQAAGLKPTITQVPHGER